MRLRHPDICYLRSISCSATIWGTCQAVWLVSSAAAPFSLFRLRMQLVTLAGFSLFVFGLHWTFSSALFLFFQYFFNPLLTLFMLLRLEFFFFFCFYILGHPLPGESQNLLRNLLTKSTRFWLLRWAQKVYYAAQRFPLAAAVDTLSWQQHNPFP